MAKLRESVSELLQHSDLLLMLTWKDIKVRYKQSAMGFLWAILMPSIIIGAGVLVRYAFSSGVGRPFNPTDVASIALKSLPWAFFVSSVRFATSSLTSNGNLVTKIYFPREVFPLAAVLASLFDFGVASGIVIAVLAAARVGVSIYLLWFPLILLLLIILVSGLAMLLSCANLFLRDVKYLVEIFLTFGILFTPVFYDVKMFGKWAPLLLLNPLAPLLEAMNDVVILHTSPNLFWLGYAAGWAVPGLIISWNIFDKAEASFAESI